MPNIALSSANENNEEGFVPYWAVAATNTGNNTYQFICQSIHGTWLLNFNTINLEFYHSLSLGSFVKIDSHFGLQNGWIHQKINALFSRSLTERSTPNAVVRDQIAQMNNNFWGIGVTGGIDGEVDIYKGLKFTANTALSLLTGRTSVRSVHSVDIGGGGGFVLIDNMSDRVVQFAPGIKVAMGLLWQIAFNGCEFLNVSALWESNYWLEQHNFLQPNYSKNSSAGARNYARTLFEYYPYQSGPLYVEGVVVRGSYDF